MVYIGDFPIIFFLLPSLLFRNKHENIKGGLTLLHAIMRCSLGHHRRVTLRDTLGHQCGTASRRVACDALSNVNVL